MGKRSSSAMLAATLLSTTAMAQVREWLDPSPGDWADASRWDGGVPDSQGETARISAPGTYGISVRDIRFDIAAFEIDNPGTTVILDGGHLTTVAPSRNLGRIHMTRGGFLSLGGDLFGAGEILLDALPFGAGGIHGTGYTIGTGQVIHGSGSVSGLLRNSGHIVADDPRYRLSVNGIASWVNEGAMVAREGGELHIGGLIMLSSSGVIRAEAGSTARVFRLQGSGEVLADGGTVSIEDLWQGVTFRTQNGGIVRNAAAASPQELNSCRNEGELTLVPPGIHVTGSGIVNNGAIELTSLGRLDATTTVFFPASVEITGAGSIRLNRVTSSSTNAGAQISTPRTVVVRIGRDQHVWGSGHLTGNFDLLGSLEVAGAGNVINLTAAFGGGTQAFVNNGAILIQNHGALVAEQSVTNNTICRVRTGGQLWIGSNHTWTQSADAALIADGVSLDLNDCQISGGRIQAENGGSLTGSGLHLNGVTLDLPAEIARRSAAVVAQITGLVTSTRSITVRTTNQSQTTILMNANSQLAGAGEVVLAPMPGAPTSLRLSGAGVIAADKLIRGAGIIGGIRNAGTLRADLPLQPLLFNQNVTTTNDGIVEASGGYVHIGGTLGSFVNNGLIRANPESWVYITGLVNQSPQAAIVADGGIVSLGHAGGAAISGGTVRVQNGGRIELPSGTALLTNVRLEAEEFSVGGSLRLGGGTFVNDALLTVAPGFAGVGEMTATTPTQVTGRGVIRLDGSSAKLYGAITIGPDMSVLGRADIDDIVNNGIIDADRVRGELRLRNVTNNHICRATRGLLTVNDCVQGPQGRMVVDGGGLAICGLTGGTLETPNGLAVVEQSCHLVNVVNHGHVRMWGPTIGAVFENHGTVYLSSAPQGQRVGAITVPGGGSLITGTGRIHFERNAPSDSAAAIFTAGDDQVVANGDQHTMMGFGRVVGSLTNTGVLCPGDPIGTFTVSREFNAGTESTLVVEIGGYSAGTDHDQLIVQRSATLGGELIILQASGFVPPVGARFTILTAAMGVSGQFSRVVGAGQYAITYHADSVEITRQNPAGDMDCDGMLTNVDIDGFVMAIMTPEAYLQIYPDCDLLNGDMNGDGVLTNFDIDPFVDALVNGP